MGQSGVVELVLIRIALGELGVRPVESAALAEVGADRDPVARSGVAAS
jgi:hypothetical protein